ncbi:hypothetical protein YC2023_002132 [Brassica napus]
MKPPSFLHLTILGESVNQYIISHLSSINLSSLHLRQNLGHSPQIPRLETRIQHSVKRDNVRHNFPLHLRNNLRNFNQITSLETSVQHSVNSDNRRRNTVPHHLPINLLSLVNHLFIPKKPQN